MENKRGNVLRIDDGTREIVLENTFGEEICKLRFRPGDISILDRLGAIRNDLPNIIAPLEQADINADGTGATDESWKLVKGVENALLDKLCDVFDSQDVRKIFEKRFMFSAIHGDFFVTLVLDGLTDEISRVIGEEMKLSQAKLDKYLKPEPDKPAKKPAGRGGKRAGKPATSA